MTSAPPDGRWALIFSTQAELPDASRPRTSSPVQGLIDATYAAFFKVAPALAGAQQDGRSGASNEQALSLDTGVVENRVRIPLPFLPSILEIRVDGRVAEAGAAETEPLLDVTFTECSFALQRSGADDGVQVQEQLEQRALLARATATGRADDSQCQCRVCT